MALLGISKKSSGSKPKPDLGAPMSLRDHLRELRNRLIKAMLAILIGLVIGLIVAEPVQDFINAPYCDRFAEKCKFTAQSPVEPFLLTLKVGLYVGILLASPFWLYQLWAFIAPGLYRREKRWAYIFAAVATPLFLAGAILAHFVVSKGLSFLLPSDQSPYDVDVNISGYFDFVTGMLLIFGAAFEFPLIVFMLNLAGVASAKKLLSWWRIVVFLIFVFTAIVTPTPDPFGMTALAIPMSILYFMAVGAAFLNDRRRARRASTELPDDVASPL